MDIHIEWKRNEPKYLQLYEQLKNSIVTGILQSDEKLPSKRSFAADLHVSIHTVQQAYEQLVSEGYIYSKERSGYFVAPYDIEWGMPTVDVCFEQPQPIAINYNFKNGQVDELAFPFKQWLKLYKQHLEPAVVANSSWQGEFSLRQQN